MGNQNGHAEVPHRGSDTKLSEIKKKILSVTDMMDELTGLFLRVHHQFNRPDGVACDFVSSYVDSSMGENARKILVFKTPTSLFEVHISIEFNTYISGRLRFFEGVIWE